MSLRRRARTLEKFLREWADFLLNPRMSKAFPGVLEAVPRTPESQAEIHRLHRH
jgi:hypothetical protein